MPQCWKVKVKNFANNKVYNCEEKVPYIFSKLIQNT